MLPASSLEFDTWARQGDGLRMEESHSFAGKRVLDRIAVGYDQSFIDLGTGNGWAVRYIAERVPTIGLCVGVDGSAEFIKEARALSAGKYPVKFIQSAIEDIPFGEGSFDHAFSMEALYYAKDPVVALRSIWRVLKPGGTFHMVIDFYAENPASKRWQDGMATPMHFLPEAAWRDLFAKAGFVDVRSERILDDRPVPPDMEFPQGDFDTAQELAEFRTKVGSLHVTGQKGEFSHALDPFVERAGRQIMEEERAGGGLRSGGTPSRRERRAGRRGR